MPATSNMIQYMKKTAILCVLLFYTYSCIYNTEDIKPNPVVPSDKQVEYQSMEFLGFIHYNLFTFPSTIKDPDKKKWWGNEPASTFNPLDVDTEQWVRVAKDAGMKELILTVKLHDGFCNWPCWWIQNSYGPSYGMMPFLQEPYATWLDHSQALWFRTMGDGKRKDDFGFIGPDGCLCDAAGVYLNGGEALGFGDPRIIGRYSNLNHDGSIHNECVVYRQGDGEVKLHDWFMGATAAGLVMETERLLIRHDPEKARDRLPQLQRVAAFLDSRRNPVTNLLKAGRAANLLAPHDLVLPNYPSYDDHSGEGAMSYGTWVNGGHWTTTQGRMNIACMRVDEFDHPVKSWKRILGLMQGFRADAPLKERGETGWFHGRFSFDIVYDCWGAPGGLLRGLFEYDYHSDGLRIRPHLPPDITRFTQKWPVMFGNTQIYISVTGTGPAKSALADKEELPLIDGWIELKPDGTPGILSVEILRGDAKPRRHWKPDSPGPLKLPEDKDFWHIPENANQDNRHADLKNIYLFYNELIRAGFKDSYEAAMARASLELLSAMNERIIMLKDSSLIIPDLAPVLPCDNDAVNLNYFEKARFIAGGLVDRLEGYSIWNEHSDPEIVAIAHKIKLIK
jgi:hypothetical protein